MQDHRQTEAIQIQTRMAVVRTGARRQLDQVVHHAKELTDWKVQVRRHPFWAAGALATAGYLVSSILAGRHGPAAPRPTHPLHDPLVGLAGMARTEGPGVPEGQVHERSAHAGPTYERRVQESSLAGTVVKMMAGVVAQHVARMAITAISEWCAEAARPTASSERPHDASSDLPRASDKGP